MKTKELNIQIQTVAYLKLYQDIKAPSVPQRFLEGRLEF